MEYPNETAIIRKDVARLVAQVHGVSPRYVRMVINGDRTNEEILATYMEIVEQDNLLIQNLAKAIPTIAL
jgi:hypothetical protein